jgi:hypothetical protein
LPRPDTAASQSNTYPSGVGAAIACTIHDACSRIFAVQLADGSVWLRAGNIAPGPAFLTAGSRVLITAIGRCALGGANRPDSIGHPRKRFCAW